MPAHLKNIARSSLVTLLAVAGIAAGGDLRLVDAAKRQDKATLRALLQQRVDVNAIQADGATALHWAVYWDDLEAANLLIRARAAVNAADDLGVTPLSLACANGNAGIVEALLKAGAKPNAAALETRETPLMAAARTGNVRVVKALLAYGADVNARETAHEQTALMWAAAHRHPQIVKALVEAGADVSARSRVSPRLVSRGNRYPRQNDFSGVAEVPVGGFTPLLFAARQGDRSSADILLAAGANANDAAPDGTSALVIAAHSGNARVAALLLEKAADANRAGSGYTALHAAALRGDVELAKTLLAHGANPNAPLTQGTPVRRWSKDYALSDTFIGATPYWLAAKFAEAELMRLLAAAGADSRVTIKDGTTALMAAAGVGAGGGSADRRERRIDPLDIAARGPDEEQARTLEAVKVAVAADGDVNAANEMGETALHGAAASGSHATVRFLAEHGAKLDLMNKRGQTPLMLASASRPRQDAGPKISTADLLRSLGAKE